MIFDELHLNPNRADTCIYEGILKGHMVMMAQATDDLLIATPFPEAYGEVVTVLKRHWKIHDIRRVEHYFG